MIQLLFQAPPSLLAHAGHGLTDPDSLLHFVAEPVHALLIAAPVAIGAVVFWARRVRRARPSFEQSPPSG